MTETINPKLARLLAENPDLPIKVQVDQQITGWDEYAWMMADLKDCRVTEYAAIDDAYYLRDDDEAIMDLVINEMCDSDVDIDEFDRKVDVRVAGMDWKPCILLDVGV